MPSTQKKTARVQVRHDEAEAQAATAAGSEHRHARNDGCATCHGAVTVIKSCTTAVLTTHEQLVIAKAIRLQEIIVGLFAALGMGSVALAVLYHLLLGCSVIRIWVHIAVAWESGQKH